eukprot:3583920-Pyramimonas_sp.AAC.1
MSYVTFCLPDAQARSALAGAGLGGMAHPALMAEACGFPDTLRDQCAVSPGEAPIAEGEREYE